LSIEIVAQFPGSNVTCIKQLMHFQVSCLGIIYDFIDVVYRALDGPDPPWGVWYIDLQRVGLQEPVTLGT
jgi:hypothetical protein